MTLTAPPNTVPTWKTLPATMDEVVDRAKAIRAPIDLLGLEVDAHAVDPTESLRLAGEAGLMAANVPVEFGGVWRGGRFAGWERVIEAALEVTAGDGSVGQCWSTTAVQAREIFAGPLPADTKEAMAKELLHQNRRIVASNAETGGKGPVVGRQVDGGIVVTGVKTFNTNSGGGGSDLANVGFAMPGRDGAPTRHHGLIRLNAAGVTLHGDWDNMGQRGTISQTITYDDVFVADGWFCEDEPTDLTFLAVVMSGHAMLLQGIGEGVYSAMLEYLRKVNRASMPMFTSGAADVLIHRQLGEIAAQLSAGRAYLLQACRQLVNADTDTDLQAIFIEMVKAKVACTSAALDATARVHDLTGARSTSNSYRLDRFWRNARTFASHDSIDAKNALIGAYEFTQEMPDGSLYMPGVRKL